MMHGIVPMGATGYKEEDNLVEKARVNLHRNDSTFEHVEDTM